MGIRSQDGMLYYSFNYPKGCQNREASGLKDTEKNRKTVQKQMDLITLAVKTGTYERSTFFPDVDFKDAGTTIEAFSKTWLSASNLEARTRRNYTSTMNTLNKKFGSYELTELKPIYVQKWIKDSKYAPKTIRNYLGVLSSLYTAAIANGYAKISPIPLVTLPKKGNAEDTINPFTEAEVDKLLNWLDTNEPKLHNLVLFLLRTGLRPSECFPLTFGDIDVANKSVRVVKAMDVPEVGLPPKTLVLKKPKNDRYRYVSLDKWALKAAQGSNVVPISNQPKTGYVFLNPRTGNLWDGAHLNGKLWRKALKECGITYRSIYNCRHTFASTLISKGISTKYVSVQLGHSSILTTERHYAKFMQQGIDDVLALRDSEAFEAPKLKLVKAGE